MNPLTAGRLLRILLRDLGWSQLDLAKMIRRPAQAVNEICQDKKRITATTAVALARALGTSPMLWLLLDAENELSKREGP